MKAIVSVDKKEVEKLEMVRRALKLPKPYLDGST